MSLALQLSVGVHFRRVGSFAKPSSAALIAFEHDRVISHPGYVGADLAIAKFIAP
jgi:hypothetical protein